ncbi:MAG: anaerobic ribonucleoside triphosphate reductase [Armatimonadetes bacterium]|nr:anaerobic ribonucleoside triphosphate reductase [Armatimonadota bacterium]
MPKSPPFTIIKKRDGRLASFDLIKITQAISKAFLACGREDLEIPEKLAQKVLEILEINLAGHIPQVEEIQDLVEKILIKEGYDKIAKAYILYRAKRSIIREGKSELMETVEEILKKNQQTIDGAYNSPGFKMLKIASAASSHYYLTRLIPAKYSEAHLKGEIHIHNLEFYRKTIQSIQIPLEPLLEKGFSSGYGFHRPPKRLSSALALTSIILQSSQNDTSGSQSIPFFDQSLANIFMNSSFQEEKIFQAMEGFVYNLNTMYSHLGSHFPFSSVNLGCDITPLGRKITKNLLLALEKGLGKGETPLFPEIIFHLKKEINFEKNSPNYDLFQLALKVCQKRMQPIFAFLDSPFNQGKIVSYWGNGQRIILDDPKAGIGVISTVSINLPHLVFKIIREKKKINLSSFIKELENTFKIASSILIHRLEILSNLKVKELPFIMGEKLYLDSEKLSPLEEIKEALKNGNLAISFTGLAESLILLTEKHHGESEKSQKIGIEIINHLNQLIKTLKEKRRLNFILGMSPSEKISIRFAKLDLKNFGAHLVNQKKYYTSSFYIPTDAEINLKDKIYLEGAYHQLLEGGHFTFINLEKENLKIERLEEILKLMLGAKLGLGGFSFPLDECANCANQLIKGNRCGRCQSEKIRKLRRGTIFIAPLEQFNAIQKEELKKRKNY